MRDLCRKFQISSVEHITALIALYRPGPMELIPEFIKRRHGEIEDRIRASVAGADLPRDLRHHDLPGAGDAGGAGAGRLHARRGGFAAARHGQEEARGDGQAARDLRQGLRGRRTRSPTAKANQIFDLLEKFAGYGFNKSHAAAYAIVAYQTAYLKANYPVEFFCAMMTNDMADTDKLSQYIAEARGDGHRGAAAGCERKPGAFRAGARQTAQRGRSRFRPGGHQGRGRDRGGSHPQGAQRSAGSSPRWPTCASAWTAAR